MSFSQNGLPHNKISLIKPAIFLAGFPLPMYPSEGCAFMGGGSGAKAPHYISLFPHALFFSLSTRRSSLFTIHYSLST
ncbi:MAG TPA: hypothetical protein PK936_09350, partial [Smithellaceae bacterium]|nr:hypothetical protein [Smithellaceae bacterium]